MKLSKITAWLDHALDVKSFSDVSNNGVQIARSGEDVEKVAFGVDASVATVKAAVEAGAQLLVVHHGISWGGGIQRIAGGVYNVVKAAMDTDLALYAVHLPLDANHAYGNNYELARFLGLKNLKPAFVYHGETIGVTGTLPNGKKVGVCSGGAGAYAPEAKELGCDLYVTGEADWGETIAAENVGMPMICAGHYATETFGVKALAKAMARRLKVKTVFLPRPE
jgi:putative NIF3 family GTP cyclohydrolase 1 type 2